VLCRLHRSNPQKQSATQIQEEKPLVSTALGGYFFYFFFRKSNGILVVYKRLKNQRSCTFWKDQTQFWNEKSISKPHILLTLIEEPIAILYTLQTCCCSPVWGQEISKLIWTVIYRGPKEKQDLSKIMECEERFKNFRIFRLKRSLR